MYLKGVIDLKFKSLRKNITMFNALTNILAQLLTIVSSLIIPKIILEYLGSNVNGLVSSISQFLSYIYLFEGGITAIVASNLYRHLYHKNYDKVNLIFL